MIIFSDKFVPYPYIGDILLTTISHYPKIEKKNIDFFSRFFSLSLNLLPLNLGNS
jgi:hypothetical protein